MLSDGYEYPAERKHYRACPRCGGLLFQRVPLTWIREDGTSEGVEEVKEVRFVCVGCHDQYYKEQLGGRSL